MLKEKFIDSWGVDHSLLPVSTVTDYHKDSDEYIIDYQEVEHVKMLSDKDTDFVKTIEVEECGRTNRQDYISSFSDDVGILNIMKKVALSGDESLLNQTGRHSLPGNEEDALGRRVEDVVDLTRFSSLDRVDALNGFKKGAASFAELDSDLKGKKSLEQVAKMSDADIDAWINSKVDAYKAAISKIKSQESEAK